MDELRMEIANARVSEQQTDKAFVFLNKELNKLETEDSLPRNRRSPVLSDFYTPSDEMHKYQSLSAIIIGGVIGFGDIRLMNLCKIKWQAMKRVNPFMSIG